jgi:hypothetical protein
MRYDLVLYLKLTISGPNGWYFDASLYLSYMCCTVSQCNKNCNVNPLQLSYCKNFEHVCMEHSQPYPHSQKVARSQVKVTEVIMCPILTILLFSH